MKYLRRILDIKVGNWGGLPGVLKGREERRGVAYNTILGGYRGGREGELCGVVSHTPVYRELKGAEALKVI